MTDNLIDWLFWSGAAVVGYGSISSLIRYFHFWRRGHSVMAAQSGLQTMLCTAGLVVMWLLYQKYLPV
ncbi:MAG: hypothetical protein ABI607_04845 [Betaproteobacteria bacterium]